MEFQRYEYLSRRQSPGLFESELIFIYTEVYIKNELSSLPRGHLILTT